MGGFVAEAVAIVKRAEEDVRRLIEAAAKDRSYGEVPRLARFAENLARLGTLAFPE